MNYGKPEITSLASASSVIQSTNPTKGPQGQDNRSLVQTSISAYEADE